MSGVAEVIANLKRAILKARFESLLALPLLCLDDDSPGYDDQDS
jgi:hypothetical protein